MTAIGDYVSELRSKLRVGRRAKRRILAEIEEHLRDAAHEEEQLGINREEAERRAVDRLGSVEILAARFQRPSRKRLVAGAAVGLVLIAEATTALVLAVGGTPKQAAPLAWSATIDSGGSGTLSITSPTSLSITAGGSSTSTITVTARDAFANSVSSSGRTVTLTQESGTGAIGSITENGGRTITATITGH